MSSPLHELSAAGQSIWLDYIDRGMLSDGSLVRRIEHDALTGITSNPTIFEKALAEGAAYDDQIRQAPDDLTAAALFEAIATEDVRRACDAFSPVAERTGGADGFVSIEVSPHAAHDAAATVAEARRLWSVIDRKNLMIKVPGTAAGAQAIEELIAAGINVNVTLLFSVEAHARVIDAHISGLEARARSGHDVAGVHSVASFFVSRVDNEVDRRLGEAGADGSLMGKAAIANAKLAYQLFRERTASQRWQGLASLGARVQRPLWASTSTKNPAYRDVLYVEELIGPDTVNTMPPQTIEPFRDHGRVARTIDRDVDDAARVLERIEASGVRLSDVTDLLLQQGLVSFQKSYDSLIAGLEAKTRSLGRALAAR
jgi:transaldolase